MANGNLSMFVNRVNKMLAKLVKTILQYLHLRREFKKTKKSSKLKDEFVVFNSIKSDELVFGVEFLILLMISRKGAKCAGIIDDGVFSHHDFIQKCNNFNYINPQKKQIYIWRRKLLSLLHRCISKNIEIVYVSQLKDVTWCPADQYIVDNLCVKHAVSSTKRYFQVAFYDKTDKDQKTYYDLSYINSQLSIKIACFVLNCGATKYLTSHGIYSCWGPAYDYLAYKQFQNVYIYGTNTYKSGEVFISKEKLQLQSKCNFLRSNILIELEKNQILDAEAYLDSRVNKKTKDNRVYYNFDLRSIKIDKSKRNIFLFPNVIWDGDIPEKDTLFSGLVDWITETIKFAAKHKDINLYIRFHPAETSWYKNSAKLQDTIIPLTSDIVADNIFFILSGDNIDLYDVIPEIDLLVLYDGILSVESAYLKKPFMLASTGRFSVDRFGAIPQNKMEYFDALINYNPSAIDLEYVYQLGLKLTYIYHFLISVPIPSISNNTTDFGVDLTKCNASNLDLDNNKKLQRMLGLL